MPAKSERTPAGKSKNGVFRSIFRTKFAKKISAP